jgi:hypothetical protein
MLLWIVAKFYEAWLSHRDAIGRPVSKLIRREFERFSRCGNPAFGYAALGCMSCGFQLGVAASCKGSAWCPYCLSRRQAKHTTHLVDGIFGSVPVRHWVLCLPPRLRYTIGYNPGVLSATVNAFARSIRRYLRWKAKRELKLESVDLSHSGAVSFIHRCSANVDTNVHFHCLVPDGVFIQRDGGPVEFHALSRPTDQEIEQVALRTCRLVCAALERRGFWSWSGDRSSTTTIEGVLRFGDRKARPAKFFPQAARHGEGGVAPRNGAYAFHVNADHLVEAGDRRSLMELVEYVLAPPLADAQLSFDEGNIVIRMKRPRHDQSVVDVVEPLTFLDRLAALVSRARSNAIRYHGIYGSNARLRAAVVPWPAVGTRVADDTPADAPLAMEAKAHAVYRAKHHAPTRRMCPECATRLILTQVVTRRFMYRKPGWEPPSVGLSSGSKTGSGVTDDPVAREGESEIRG